MLEDKEDILGCLGESLGVFWLYKAQYLLDDIVGKLQKRGIADR